MHHRTKNIKKSKTTYEGNKEKPEKKKVLYFISNTVFKMYAKKIRSICTLKLKFVVVKCLKTVKLQLQAFNIYYAKKQTH